MMGISQAITLGKAENGLSTPAKNGLYEVHSRYAEAEPLYKRALAICVRGPAEQSG